MSNKSFSNTVKNTFQSNYVLSSLLLIGAIIFIILSLTDKFIWTSAENSFWNSTLCQTIVLICTILATVLITFWQVRSKRRRELRNAALIVLLQVKDIESNIDRLKSESILNGVLQEKPFHYCPIIYEENQWDKYAHIIAGHVSNESFEAIDTFFKISNKIREQQILIKHKLQQASDCRVCNYYNTVYHPTRFFTPDGQIQANIEYLNNVNEQIKDVFDKIYVQSYVIKEYSIGLEMMLKLYHKLTDGVAYMELKELSN